MSHNFAITGVAGFVAPRHLRAIMETGNRVVAATDPHDCVGILDRFSLDARYFPEFERFDRHLEKLRRGADTDRVHFVSVCSPNYLHDAHIRLALRVGADVICEKPLVINPWNLDALQVIENETGHRINTVLQLRLHPALVAVKQRIDAEERQSVHEVRLVYITGRGRWYRASWKGSVERSGGLGVNIGIHLFDALLWLFGKPSRSEVVLRGDDRMAGILTLERANVSWFLSLNPRDLPFAPKPGETLTYRSLMIDEDEVEFSGGFADLHTRLYEETLAGNGFGIDDARPSIELAYRVRCDALSKPSNRLDPEIARFLGM